MLSPGARSAASGVPIRSRNPSGVGLTSATSPIDSINPVNITLNLHVDPDRPAGDAGRPPPGRPGRPDPGDPPWSEHRRRDKELDAVDGVSSPDRLGEPAPPLDREWADSRRSQHVDCRG